MLLQVCVFVYFAFVVLVIDLFFAYHLGWNRGHEQGLIDQSLHADPDVSAQVLHILSQVEDTTVGG